MNLKTTITKKTATLYVFLIALLTITSSSFKNKTILEDFITFEMADEVPLFKGCEKSNTRREAIECFNKKMTYHIKNNFTYPEEAFEKKIEGKVEISFIINEAGVVKDVVAVASNDKEYDRKLLETEAKRIITKLPKFTPGKHQGKIVNIKYGLPITFRLM